ncbi:MAG: hypothetical protein ACOX9C_06060 [Kiritimatiellia bacterium]
MIDRCLEDLERQIVPEVEDRLEADWLAFTEGRFEGAIFSPSRARPCPGALEWPAVSVNQAQADLDAMALQQYGACASQLASGRGGMLCVRANYGTGIMPALFGAEIFVMDESTQTLQTTLPLGAAAMEDFVAKGVPALETSLGANVFAAGRRFAEIARRYPKIGRYVHIYHPDLQGPMDVCEMLWGSDMFLDLIDRPERVHQVLALVTETHLRFMTAWNDLVGVADNDWATHWGLMHGGKIMIRTDSGVNLSPDMYDTFVRPYDERLLVALGGGAVHFCGRGSHYIASACAMPGLRAVNLSQPHLNDMEAVFRATVDQGIKIVGLDRDAAEAAIRSGRDLLGCVHCW